MRPECRVLPVTAAVSAAQQAVVARAAAAFVMNEAPAAHVKTRHTAPKKPGMMATTKPHIKRRYRLCLAMGTFALFHYCFEFPYHSALGWLAGYLML